MDKIFIRPEAIAEPQSPCNQMNYYRVDTEALKKKYPAKWSPSMCDKTLEQMELERATHYYYNLID